MEPYKEGKAKIYAPQGKISKKLPVFFNPRMKLNRDICIWLAKKLELKEGCCALAGTGIRAIRLALEAGMEITANDTNPQAADLIKENARLNNAEITIENKDANILLREKCHEYTDIDPFGSPMPFIASAISSLKNKGILAATATDLACMCGTSPKACRRKYLANPLKCPMSKEIGIRIMIKRIQEEGAMQSKALTPIFSNSTEHYFRVYFLCEKGKEKCDQILSQHKNLLYCSSCFSYSLGEDGECCGKNMAKAGPLWAGQLWDKELTKDFEIIKHIREESKEDLIGFYSIPKICKKNKMQQKAKIEEIIKELKSKGYKASRTHFDQQGIRTDAKPEELKKLIFPPS